MTADLAALGARLRLLTDAQLRAVAGPTTFTRGQGYAAQRRVSGLAASSTWVVSAKVRGSGRIYQTQVELYLSRGEVLWTGECTCPMQVDCKHSVAVAIVARQTFGLAGAATLATPAAYVSDSDLARWAVVPALDEPASWTDQPPPDEYDRYDYDDDGYPDPLAALHHLHPGAPTTPGLPAWERAVRAVVGDTAATTTHFTPVGLLFEVQVTPPNRYSPPGSAHAKLLVRPMVPGKTGWVRTGLTWGNLDYASPYGQIKLNPVHQSALQAVVAIARQPYGYRPIADRVDLAVLGRGWFAALRECQRLGIKLLTDPKRSGEVTLAEEPARVVVHLTSDGEGGLLVGPTIVEPAEVAATQGDWEAIGSPATGMWVAHGDDLVIAAFEPAVDVPTQRWLVEGGQRVPAGDVARFFAGHLPALAKRFDVLSPDGSVEVPTVGAPRLLLRLTHEPGLRLSLAWSFTYAVGQDRVEVAVGSSTEPTIRDLAAEERLIDGLDALDKAPGLRTARPTVGWSLQPRSGLDGSPMLRFLNLVLPRLEEHPDVDIEVLGTPIPYAEADEAPTVSLAITESSDSTDWFDLDVQVRVGPQDVPIRSLVTALTLGEEHVILPSGTWFRVDRPELTELRRLIDEARAMSDDPKGPLRLSAYQADLWAELEELGVVQEQSERWRSLVAGLAGAAEGAPPEPVPAPDGLAAELRHYQHSGYEWLTFLRRAGLGGILADDMGLGKTMQTLAMILRAVQDREEAADAEGATGAGGERAAYPPFLVVAPTSVLPTWLAEAARFAPSLRVVALGETTKRRRGSIAEAIAGADLVVTTYAVFRIDADAFRECAWSALVLDEAQFVKNHQSQVYQCARLLPARTKLAITGTPMENNLMELWALLSIVAPGLFPRPAAFAEHFRRPIESGTAPERLDTLRRRIRPVMLRRTKDAVASELP
ncbi:MAG TPA: SNF2-related protein, partial [Dermatophilaceae bacterium]|nr:SNF2-related protein [Dermatophilaceae bacterium]